MAWVDLSGAFGYGTILTSTQMQNLRDNLTALANGDSGAPAIDYLKVGTYQGDGTEDQGVTGVGWQPKGVLVVSDNDTASASAFMRLEGMTSDLSLALINGQLYSNKIISIDADGFSVDDGGSDQHPNTDTHDYVYIAWR